MSLRFTTHFLLAFALLFGLGMSACSGGKTAQKRYQESFEVRGTPCEIIVEGRKAAVYEAGVWHIDPEDQVWVDCGCKPAERPVLQAEFGGLAQPVRLAETYWDFSDLAAGFRIADLAQPANRSTGGSLCSRFQLILPDCQAEGKATQSLYIGFQIEKPVQVAF